MKIILTLLIISFFTVSCGKNKHNSKIRSETTYETQTDYQPSESETQKWYQGGTLHKSTVAEWKNASDRNKLATCGDFVANMVDKSTSIDVIKIKSENLKTCIDEAVKGSDYTNDYKVSRIAAICAVSMGN